MKNFYTIFRLKIKNLKTVFVRFSRHFWQFLTTSILSFWSNIFFGALSSRIVLVAFARHFRQILTTVILTSSVPAPALLDWVSLYFWFPPPPPRKVPTLDMYVWSIISNHAIPSEAEKVRDPGILDPRKDLYLTESFWHFPLRRELPLTNRNSLENKWQNMLIITRKGTSFVSIYIWPIFNKKTANM